MCFLISAARDSRSIHGSFVRRLPADFKAPKVDGKVGLQDLGCQLGTVLKKNNSFFTKDKQTAGGVGEV